MEIITQYLRATSLWRMFLHLVWLLCLLMMLSSSYIITFHFVPVMDLFRKSHSLTQFSAELGMTIALDQQVNTILQTLLTQTNSSRTYLFRYHNGIPSVNGMPFIFHTMTHELIRPGTTRVIVFNQRLPTGILGTSNTQMVSRRCVTLNYLDRSTESINGWHYNMRGAVAVVRCPFFSAQGDLLGFVGVDFNERVDDTVVEAAHVSAQAAAERLNSIFQNRPARN
jgi:hypothetical protein